MKITSRQAQLIAQDIYDHLKVKNGIATPEERKAIDSYTKKASAIEKELAVLAKKQKELQSIKDEHSKELSKALNCNFNNYCGSPEIKKQAENIVINRNRPSVYTIQNKVELAALKTEYKDIDKFIAEITKQFIK